MFITIRADQSTLEHPDPNPGTALTDLKVQWAIYKILGSQP